MKAWRKIRDLWKRWGICRAWEKTHKISNLGFFCWCHFKDHPNRFIFIDADCGLDNFKVQHAWATGGPSVGKGRVWWLNKHEAMKYMNDLGFEVVWDLSHEHYEVDYIKYFVTPSGEKIGRGCSWHTHHATYLSPEYIIDAVGSEEERNGTTMDQSNH